MLTFLVAHEASKRVVHINEKDLLPSEVRKTFSLAPDQEFVIQLYDEMFKDYVDCDIRDITDMSKLRVVQIGLEDSLAPPNQDRRAETPDTEPISQSPMEDR